MTASTRGLCYRCIHKYHRETKMEFDNIGGVPLCGPCAAEAGGAA